MTEAVVDPNATDSIEEERQTENEPPKSSRERSKRQHEHSAITIKLSNKTLGRVSPDKTIAKVCTDDMHWEGS